MTTKSINGFELNPLGIGTWTIGGAMEAEHGEEEKAYEGIRYSISKGQNHIDTAEMYGNGHSEEIVGEAIKGLDRSKLFVASKLHRTYSKAENVVKSTEEILKRLQTDYLDLLYIHSYWDDENMDLWLTNANKAVDAGLAKGLAVSNWSSENLEWGIAHTNNKILANQMNYNILHQSEVPADMKELCEKEEIVIVAYRPIERRLLADQCENKTVLEIAEKYSATPAQIALSWLISQKNVHAIPKSLDKAHIDENLAALELELSKDDLQTLNSIN